MTQDGKSFILNICSKILHIMLTVPFCPHTYKFAPAYSRIDWTESGQQYDSLTTKRSRSTHETKSALPTKQLPTNHKEQSTADPRITLCGYTTDRFKSARERQTIRHWLEWIWWLRCIPGEEKESKDKEFVRGSDDGWRFGIMWIEIVIGLVVL